MNTMVQVNVIDSSQQKKDSYYKDADLPSRWDLSFSETTFVSWYCFIKNFIGSSQPEKIASSEAGQEVDPSAGSTAPSGTNTVAIDNKIEQAMDLVKSHLMFAVREEVEVLKEKITELLERINLLETENDILRASASAETLNQLPIQNQKGTVNTTVSPPST